MTDPEYAPFYGDSPPEQFNILALDGGGAKALFTAHVLARLEEDLQTSIRDHFDLIAGTSAGGIIALALGAGVPPAEIADQYERLAEKVFPKRRRRKWRYPLRAVRPAYSAAALRDSLSDVIGSKALHDSEKRLVIPSWNVETGCVRVFKTPHHRRLRRDHRIPMVDVGLATTAAPTYLPAARVDDQRLIDGGVWANNPSVVAITEALSMLGVPLTAMRVLNVGTTQETTNHAKRLDNGGIATWAARAVPLILTASTRGGQGTAEHLVGRGKYRRFDATVATGLYALDEADADDMRGLGSTVSLHLTPQFATEFLPHTAGDYRPLCNDSEVRPGTVSPPSDDEDYPPA